VQTDHQGRYAIPYDDETVFFVIKPSGWRPPLDDNNLPLFYYVHQPAGSPDYEYAGVSPSGGLPESIDFPLYKQTEPASFDVILFTDPQPRNQNEIDYIAHDVVEELIGCGAAFGVTLGDLVYDDLSLLHGLNKTQGLIGAPWINVPGNHDLNFDAPHDSLSNETIKKIYGPPYYSFNYGGVHFIVMEDIEWFGEPTEENNLYDAHIDEHQLVFIKNDLAFVPRDQWVVLFMHIPLPYIQNRHELYRLIESHHRVLSISGHMHYIEHNFITAEDDWRGSEPHHHFINPTVSGSWWSGAKDERGIPHTTMRDGVPNGYCVMRFEGGTYDIAFKAAGYPASYQMNVYAPEEAAAETAHEEKVTVNVFAGSPRSTVEMRIGSDPQWIPMRRVPQKDPYYLQTLERENLLQPPPDPKLPDAYKTPHIWEAELPQNLAPGTHLIHVRTTDMFGKTYFRQRVIKIN
jgi:hypothetical protein